MTGRVDGASRAVSSTAGHVPAGPAGRLEAVRPGPCRGSSRDSSSRGCPSCGCSRDFPLGRNSRRTGSTDPVGPVGPGSRGTGRNSSPVLVMIIALPGLPVGEATRSPTRTNSPGSENVTQGNTKKCRSVATRQRSGREHARTTAQAITIRANQTSQKVIILGPVPDNPP